MFNWILNLFQSRHREFGKNKIFVLIFEQFWVFQIQLQTIDHESEKTTIIQYTFGVQFYTTYSIRNWTITIWCTNHIQVYMKSVLVFLMVVVFHYCRNCFILEVQSTQRPLNLMKTNGIISTMQLPL